MSAYSRLCDDPFLNKACKKKVVGEVVLNTETKELELALPKSASNKANTALQSIRNNIDAALPQILDNTFGGAGPREIGKIVKAAAKATRPMSQKQRIALANNHARLGIRKGSMPECLRAWHGLSKQEKRAHIEAKKRAKIANVANAGLRRRTGRHPKTRHMVRGSGPCGPSIGPMLSPYGQKTVMRKRSGKLVTSGIYPSVSGSRFNQQARPSYYYT